MEINQKREEEDDDEMEWRRDGVKRDSNDFSNYCRQRSLSSDATIMSRQFFVYLIFHVLIDNVIARGNSESCSISRASVIIIDQFEKCKLFCQISTFRKIPTVSEKLSAFLRN